MAVIDLRSLETGERHARGERLNIAPSGRRFRCDFIEPGLVDYSDVGGDIEYISRETIQAALDSFIGNPLTIGHVSTKLNGTALIPHTRGTIEAARFNPDSGWFECEGPTDDEGRDRIRRCGKASVGYTVLEFGPAGTHHNVPYAREISRIKFHHLAIVENPRYEEADIRLNGKPKPAMNLIKWINKKLSPAKEAGGQPTEETLTGELPADTQIVLADGKTVRLNELTEAKIKADADAAAKELAARANSLDGDTMIEYAPGKHCKLNDLTKCYQTFGPAEKCNDADKDADAKKKEDDEKRENARQQAERENGAQSFKIVAGARNLPAPVKTELATSANSLAEQVARGQSRYGSLKPGKN